MRVDVASSEPDPEMVEPELQHRIEQFLYSEADMLDSFELGEWLEHVTEEMVLKVPVRTARSPGSERSEFSSQSYYLKDDYDMLRERVIRLDKEYAWSENPRSRVRHVIGNVTAYETETGYEVFNNQHVFRSQGDTPDHALISARRRTLLGETDDSFEIRDRTVYLDHNILNTTNITLPLL